MKPKERFLTALNGGIPDRVPICEHLFSRRLLQEKLGYTTVLYDGEAQTKLATELGIDGIWTPVNVFCGIEGVKEILYVHVRNTATVVDDIDNGYTTV